MAEGAVEVNDMDPAGTGGDEPLRLCYGIVVVGGFAGRLALTEADDAAGTEVNRGKEIHGRRPAQTARS